MITAIDNTHAPVRMGRPYNIHQIVCEWSVRGPPEAKTMTQYLRRPDVCIPLHICHATTDTSERYLVISHNVPIPHDPQA